jgi:hypothetical protein
MNTKHRIRFLWVVLVIAWIFDFLFWKKAPGISFFLYVSITLAGGLLLALMQGLRPAKTVWILMPLTLFFAFMTSVRLEQMTVFLNALMTLALMGLTAVSFLGGKWWNYNIIDYFANAFRLVIAGVTQTLLFLTSKNEKQESLPASGNLPIQKSSKGWAIVRGILLALPILSVLSLLLAAADPIFAREFDALLKLFKLENLAEYLFRLGYILLGAYLLGGIYLYAFNNSQNEQLTGLEKPWLPPFLGFVL